MPTLSVVVPVYNEARTAAAIVERLRAVDLPLEIIAVDDATTDGSGDLLRALHAAGGSTS